LGAVAAGLRREAGTGGAGHRQQSLYKLGPMSVSLFLFAPQARLAPHQTRGTVVIQVLKGRLLVTAEGEPHELGPGGLLVLAAGVRHDVAAPEESEMLLTVTLDPPRPVPPA
jgi:quercetin dioxygenase-like cupin family protein